MGDDQRESVPWVVVQAPDADGEWFVLDKRTGNSIGYVSKYVTDQGVHWSPHIKRGRLYGRTEYPYIGENRPTRREAAALLWATHSGRHSA